jgi:hypothetical protein
MSQIRSQVPGAGGAPARDAAEAARPGGADPAARGPGAARPVAADAAPRPADRCAWQVVAGEAVLLDLEGRRILGLNPVGSFLFPLLDGRRTVAALGDAVAARFGIAAERARADAGAFLSELAARGLVTT